MLFLLALEELKAHLENPENFVEMKFLLLEQKYLELLYKGNSIEALKVRKCFSIVKIPYVITKNFWS